MSSKAEVLALFFGALLIFVTFGDAYMRSDIGNLDTIFGLALWRVLDTFYPLASIAAFLLYGWVKGNGFKFNKTTTLMFASFVLVLALVNLDDFVQIFNNTLKPSNDYWNIMMWVYPIYSAIAFILFGKISAKLKTNETAKK